MARNRCVIEGLEARKLLSAVPGGAPFQITSTAASVGNVAGNGSEFVVAWYDQGSSEVLAQRFQPNGAAIDAKPMLLGTGLVDGEGPRVAINAVGSFVVTWDLWTSGSGNKQVDARVFNAGTGTLGSVLAINKSDNVSHYPTVAMDDSGDFVVGFVDTNSGSWNDLKPLNAYARRYSASGKALGSQFQINTSGNRVTDPWVAMDSAGDFAVAWNDFALGQVFARRYNASGSALAGQFLVGTGVTYSNYNTVDVSMDSQGDFIVGWVSLVGNSGAQNYYDIYAQRYLSSGAAQYATPLLLGGDDLAFAVSTSMDSLGNAVVCWDEQDPGVGGVLYEQQIDSTGQLSGGITDITPPYVTIVLNGQPTTISEVNSGDFGVAAEPNDGFVLIWTDNSKAAPGLFGEQYIQQ